MLSSLTYALSCIYISSINNMVINIANRDDGLFKLTTVPLKSFVFQNKMFLLNVSLMVPCGVFDQ